MESISLSAAESHSLRQARKGIAAFVAAAIIAGAVAGCAGGSGVPRVTNDRDLPFVMTGVADVTEVAKLTGPGAINDTIAFGVAGTDLGSMVNIDDRTIFLFGDTFGERADDAYGGQGGMWRSNVAAWSTDEDPSDGISFDGWSPVDGIGFAAAMLEGEHDGNDAGGEVTKIPTHGFVVDDVLYVAYMSVRRWGDAGQWDANHAALIRSTDKGETWQEVDGVRWPGDSAFIQLAAVPVEDADGEQIYFWSIPAGRFGEVRLMRVAAEVGAVEDQDAYTYFRGVGEDGEPLWSTSMADAEVLVEGTIGELSVMRSDYLDRWVMTYSDAGNAYIREGITPWGPWGEPIELVSGRDYPGLYSPYLNPRYVDEAGRRIYFTLSLWGPYNVVWFSAELVRAEN